MFHTTSQKSKHPTSIGTYQVRFLIDLKSLSSTGVRLERYYVQPICSPSRNCFMTGRYPIRTGLQHGGINEVQPNGLPLDEVTLAQRLKEVGYRTHLVGTFVVMVREVIDDCR